MRYFTPLAKTHWQSRRKKFPDDMATREHLKPRSIGGIHSQANIRVACNACNNGRGNGTNSSKRFLERKARGPH